MGRSGQIKVQLFVEGYTEKHYLEQLKKKENVKIEYETVNVKGGGYSAMLSQIKKVSDLGFLAKIIILDYDLARNEPTEKVNFGKIVDYCRGKNKHGRIPYILIANNFDFEYFACLHSKSYHDSDTSKFIIQRYGYKCIEDFKSDTKVYDKLNSNGSSYQIARNTLKKQSKKTLVENNCKITHNGLNIKIINTKLSYFPEADTYKNTNMEDLLKIIL